MEGYGKDNLPTLKRTKKDMLLSAKDPNLSHLFDDNGPHTPHTASTENMAQTALNVEDSYAEETNANDFHLFNEHGSSFMAGLSPAQSQMILEVENPDTSNIDHHNSQDKTTQGSGDSIQKADANTSNRLATGVSKQANAAHSTSSANSTIPQDAYPQGKHSNCGKEETVNRAPLISPPADHYNMQLLAHSALQQQQRQQQEAHMQDMSGATFQHPVKPRQQQNTTTSDERSRLTPKLSPFPNQLTTRKDDGTPIKPVIKPLHSRLVVQGQPGVFIVPLPSNSVVQMQNKSPHSISGDYIGYTGSERDTPDFAISHVRNLSFGSQDSPVLPLHSSEGIKQEKIGMSAVSHKAPSSLTTKTSNESEPELKSPLDHPEHQLGRKGRHFFSSDSGAADDEEEENDEAPLNERDKKAAAALSELLEQNDKIPPTSLNATGASSNINQQVHTHQNPMAAAATSQRVLQMQQEISTNTPPSVYEQPVTSGQPPIHHFMQHESGRHNPIPLSPAPSLVVVETNQGQQEHSNSVATDAHQFLPGTVYPELRLRRLSSSVVKHQSNYLLQNEDAQRIGSSGSTSSGLDMSSGLAVQNDPFDPLPMSDNGKTNNTVMLNKLSANTKLRKLSSSSSGRRKSDSNLTCALCGHTFRSTPALNGHMRVHSSSDKKHLKEERLLGTAGNNLINKPSPAAPNNLSDTYSHLPAQASTSLAGDMPMNCDAVVDISPSRQYAPSSQPPQIMAHNGLLAMASAAHFLKSEPAGAEYVYSSMSQGYADPPGMLSAQQPSVVNAFISNFSERQPEGKAQAIQGMDSREGRNAQRYIVPFQQGLPLTNVDSLLQMQNAAYADGQQQTIVTELNRQNTSENPQEYIDQQIPVGMEKSMYAMPPGEGFPRHYNAHQLTPNNSLSQLASIAVAAANRDDISDVGLQGSFQATYTQHDIQSTPADPNPAPVAQWIPASLPQQECIQQQQLYQDANFASEGSSVQSGQDPYVLPVTVPVMDAPQQRFVEYGSRQVTGSTLGQRDPAVTWGDNTDPSGVQSLLFSSYDDSLMQEAVDVANPSKILPNSMMGGTPPAGSVLTGARPFRQRHHSEGAHLIKTSETSLLKQILHSPIPTIKLRVENTVSTHQNPNMFKQPNQVGEDQTRNSSNSMEKVVKPQSPPSSNSKKNEEVWAKPMPKRIRHRRHSADFRLLLKSGSVTNSRQHQGGNPNKITNLLRPKVRVRHRPPPLVIPSSASTFAPGIPGHPAFHQSNLHHRRPSGDSCSSYSGVNDKIPPYTPPPMLSPRRSGSGLFCTTPITPMFNRQKSVDGEFLIISEEDEELVRSSEPKINVGPRFQAAIPKMCPKDTVSRCRHKADRIWISEATKNHSNIYKHVEQFMELSCSAVVPFGGSNKEYALDCLAQTKGNIVAAVRRLIRRKPDSLSLRKLDKKYTGCGSAWTQEEVKLFECAMIDHRKDFYVISNKVKTRTTAECVERYYHSTKRNRRRIRLPRRFRDQEKESILSIIASSASTKCNLESFTSASSSDEDLPSTENSSLMTWHPPDKYLISSPQRPPAAYSRHEPKQPGSVSTVTHQISTKHIKIPAARIQRAPRASPSPAGSSSSNISNDDPPPQIFTCPVCHKSFGKVKSRNAHMKTHGKQAQEKRRQREEEAARRNRQSRPNFVRPAPVNATELFHQWGANREAVQQPPHYVIPGFRNNS